MVFFWSRSTRPTDALSGVAVGVATVESVITAAT